ncbi:MULTISPECIES: family 1 glycosylhydrolase [unclassified Mesorhizobium]|uniref:family 1 glycosylhydrolase n=1 Tax=unclassified Mesorhizobium TaxID=325217 RepID=UPI001092D356|nr:MULTISPECIES: family 1 glycosylhydrolase [unclassified Mesorhizobium]TGP95501.1 glycoside hydrolase family 1 protein [Mesorhizobium sp. M8A.F.Ca.ET.218.01.1.1]TGT18556.1 glycoside hydrolase family 1 protein [Mesorhizobium sp. M8A.F.Ca.ET.213.01.1.1]
MNGPLEMWGGVECSHVRVGPIVRDQLSETGHLHRTEDLELIAALGIRTLRYPVLWELVERTPGSYDWSWTDARLRRLRELGIEPVAGLLHHGSGPPWLDILDPDFPGSFARYAGAVAQRYPWLKLYTPINEPLTTARLSGLYGLWHPHGSSEAICFQLTVAQCLATAWAMRAIRSLTPAAGLVQTEDVGRVFSTEALAYQADHENERRWLALDLLAGRVDHRHPFHGRLLEAGVRAADLSSLAAEPCVPDMIGLDYYLTSDRMLDDNVDRYEHERVGGNGIDAYVDSAAVRSDRRQEAELGHRIDEVWQRYRLPIAITELHNGSTRDEQVRWLAEGWKAAQEARARGIDVRAVTAWSVFGAVDWNSLLTARSGFYESGAFDVRGGVARPTALAQTIAQLAARGAVDHPVLDGRGWWREEHASGTCEARPLLLVGFGRTISTIEECCALRRLTVVAAAAARVKASIADQRAWAAIRVEGQGSRKDAASTIRLVCHYPDSTELLLQVNSTAPTIDMCHAFLDLVIDGERGSLEMLHSGPGNQYSFGRLTIGTERSVQAESFVA